MNCKQACELITASLDGQVEEGLRPALDTHLSSCPPCRNEAELERMTKMITKRSLPLITTPPNVAAHIAEMLLEEDRHPAKRKSEWSDIFSLPIRTTVLAMGGAAAIFAILIFLLPTKSTHLHAAPKDGNIIHQTYNDYDDLLQGSLVPQIASDDPGTVKAYLAKKADFNVDVPRLHHCTLMGAFSSQYNDECVAHVIYKHGTDVIYLYETRVDSVMNGESCSLNLPEEVKTQLKKTGWYVESHDPNCSLMIWLSDSKTLCCAMAEMDKDRLLACLKQGE